MDRANQFLQVTRLMKEMMLLVNVGGILLEANPAARRMLSIGQDKLESVSLTALVADPPSRIAERLAMWARSSELLPATLSLRSAGGESIAYRAEGGLLFPPAEGQSAALMVRLRPKETMTASFMALNRQIQAANEARRELQIKLETIERQQRRIRELSAPVIDVWDDVLMLPIIGHIDDERSAHITEDLLNRIVARQASWVIIDLTSADVIDAMIGQYLVNLTSAVQLIGARCVLTGLRPQVASSMVNIGIPLDGLTFLQSLKDGLEYCLSHSRRAGEEERTARAQGAQGIGDILNSPMSRRDRATSARPSQRKSK